MRPKFLRIACLITALSAASAHAELPAQIALRSGMVMGSFSGAAQGGFTTLPYIDAEYDLFTSHNRAFAFRGVLAVNMTTGRMDYGYAGVGQRFYFGSNALSFLRIEAGRSVASSPKLKYFAGWDAGFSQVLVAVATKSLQSNATAVEAGAIAGVNWNFMDSVALQTGVSGGFGYGFTNVSVAGMVIKGFLGVLF
jgi:hypothetical protein